MIAFDWNEISCLRSSCKPFVCRGAPIGLFKHKIYSHEKITVFAIINACIPGCL